MAWAKARLQQFPVRFVIRCGYADACAAHAPCPAGIVYNITGGTDLTL